MTETENEEGTTLAELGAVLPIGIEDGGALHRAIEVKNWSLREERELGELRDKHKKASAFQFASMVLGTMCTRLGLHDFSEPSMKMPAKRLVISQMFLGDVLYAYLWLRRESIGESLKMDVHCPACGEKFGFAASIDSIPVVKVDTLEDALWDYTLKRPFKVRGEEATVLTFGPSRWHVYEKIKGAGEMKSASIVGSLFKVNGKAFPIAAHELDGMSKIDLESILVEIDAHHIGPDMSLELRCPFCTHEYKTAIDWSTDDFFGVSGAE